MCQETDDEPAAGQPDKRGHQRQAGAAARHPGWPGQQEQDQARLHRRAVPADTPATAAAAAAAG